MTVTGPTINLPLGINDALELSFQPTTGEVFDTVGVRPTVSVDFTGAGIAANGTTFKIWGYTFTVQDTSDFTSTSFKMVASDSETASNFASMIRSNIFFRVCDVQIIGSNEVLIEWKECRPQSAFSSPDMDFAGLTGAGATASATNGTAAVVKDGIQVVTSLLRYGTFGFQNITPFEGFEPISGCASVDPLKVNYMPDVRRLMFTRMPDLLLNSTGGVISEIFQRFKVMAGIVWREDCQPVSGTFAQNGEYWVVNIAFDQTDEYRMGKYWKGHPNGFEPGQTAPYFLTSQPKSYELAKDSFAWLWFLNNPASYTNLTALTLKISAKLKDGSTVTADELLNAFWISAKDISINVSPEAIADILTEAVEDLDWYSVYIEASSNDGETAATETLKYKVGNYCGAAELYFLTSKGGIGTLPMDEISSRSTVSESTEVKLAQAASADQNWIMKHGGRRTVNTRAFQKVTLSKAVDKNTDLGAWLDDFVASAQKWIRVPVGTGYKAVKFIVDPGEVQTYQSEEALIFTVTGYLNDMDIPDSTTVAEANY